MRTTLWKSFSGGLGRVESARVLISLVIVTAVMAALSENFFTVSNLSSVLSNQSIIGIVVIGELGRCSGSRGRSPQCSCPNRFRLSGAFSWERRADWWWGC